MMIVSEQFIWEKKGQIFNAEQLNLPWATDSTLVPTPFRLSKDIIRVYVGMRDGMVSRIGYVDVSFLDPKKIIAISQKPVLDIGENGCFDDNGILPAEVMRIGNSYRMYYVGFQLVNKAKFLAFSGVAISDDGDVFCRAQNYPILDRAEKATMINALHALHQDPMTGEYRIWHVKGDGWQNINGIPYPKYNIWTCTSPDGIIMNRDSQLCVDNQNTEYRIGRPGVYRYKNKWMMFYTKGTTSGKDYYPGIAFSEDGIYWERQDHYFNIPLSEAGWDSRHVAYPRLLPISDSRYYVFYNGNDMGKMGFGYAELTIRDS